MSNLLASGWLLWKALPGFPLSSTELSLLSPVTGDQWVHFQACLHKHVQQRQISQWLNVNFSLSYHDLFTKDSTGQPEFCRYPEWKENKRRVTVWPLSGLISTDWSLWSSFLSLSPQVSRFSSGSFQTSPEASNRRSRVRCSWKIRLRKSAGKKVRV